MLGMRRLTFGGRTTRRHDVLRELVVMLIAFPGGGRMYAARGKRIRVPRLQQVPDDDPASPLGVVLLKGPKSAIAILYVDCVLIGSRVSRMKPLQVADSEAL